MAASPGAAADGGAAAAPPRRGPGIDTLIRNARLGCGEALVDVAIDGGTIREIGAGLAAGPVERLVDAGGGALLPGLHDHHIHLMSLAASLDSLHCGPPEVTDAAALAARLRAENARGGGWLRGIAYHPGVAGEIDRAWLDRQIPDRPVRIQHRGGRLWLLNSRALAELGVPSGGAPTGLERVDGRYTGRLYEGDAWLRERLDSRFPDLSRVGEQLAGFGVTGVTDATPSNGCAEWSHFRMSQERGELPQRVRVMGCRDIEACRESALLRRGEFKIHLLESRLPAFDDLCRAIGEVHARGRAVAVHCVSLAELVFALAAFDRAGTLTGDRIEHASVAAPAQLQTLRELGLRVVTQPHFIAERGDQYLAEVDGDEQPWLYRGAAFLAAAIPLAGGSDAPFGSADPWRAMRAATERTTPAGARLSGSERLTPEQALSLYLSPPEAPGTEQRRLAPGAPADLCLLSSPWCTVRRDLHSRHVRMTWRAGELVHGAD